MNEIITIYTGFLLKVVTVMIAFMIIIGQIFAVKAAGKINGDITAEKLNKKHSKINDKLVKEIYSKAEQKKYNKKNKSKNNKSIRNRIFVLEFSGDIRASAVTSLRDEISAILNIATEKDQVILKLESPGGCVHDYGLAASQLARIRDRGIFLSVCVDKMAASGGYLMAAVANEIIAAPFAVIGSIGVLIQVPNFAEFLKDKKIKFEQLTAGEDKRNLTIFTENNAADKEKAQEEIDNIHKLFINFVRKYRPQIEPEKVATGKTWHAIDAIEVKLVDKLSTSDDEILAKIKSHDLYSINKHVKMGALAKLKKNKLMQNIYMTALSHMNKL